MATRFLILFLFSAYVGKAQYLLFTAQANNNAPRYLFQIDLATCEWCPVLPTPVGQFPVFLPNGNIAVGNITGGVSIYDPPSGTPIATAPGNWAGSPILHTNGTYYVSTALGLATFDPVTYVTTPIGNFPPGITISDLFMQGNTLYGFGYAGPGTAPIYIINPANPSQLTLVLPFVPYLGTITSASTGQLISSWPGGGTQPQSDFNLYDITTNSWTNICQTPLTSIFGLSQLPTSANLACACLPATAGTPTNITATVCVPNTYTSAFNMDVQTNVGDAINYILYTDPANPVGSVVFQNSTGVFPYLPPLQPNTTYYVARIVGNATNGVVSLSDPCLAISPAIQVSWKPLPQLVSMTSATNNICAGACQSINLVLEGTPPFAYGWQWQQNGNQVGFTQVQFGLQNNNFTVQACAPPGAIGPLSFVLCGITDAFCSNQP